MKITIYNQTTGEIRQWGDVPKEFVADQLGPDDAFVEGEFTTDTHYWDGKRMVEKPPRPEFSAWDANAKAWVIDLERAWMVVRGVATRRLNESADHVAPDSPNPPALVAKWIKYRQALRDVTLQPDPLNIHWPDPPA
jgi:hypothetical protein